MIIKTNKRMASPAGNYPAGTVMEVTKEVGEILIADGAELIEPEVEKVAPIEKPKRKRGAK
jgi:hypothetical protein